jgi:hypothetical protein
MIAPPSWLIAEYDPQGKDCSYNPIAFPPSMEVRCGECGKCKEQFSARPSIGIKKPLLDISPVAVFCG